MPSNTKVAGPGPTNYIGSANRVADLGINKGGSTQGVNRHVNGPDRIKCMVCKVQKPQVDFSKSQLRKFVDVEYKPWAQGKNMEFKARCIACTVRSNEQLTCYRCHVTKDLDQFKKTQRKNPDEAHCISCMQFLIESERRKEMDDSDGFGEDSDDNDSDIDGAPVSAIRSAPKNAMGGLTKKMAKASVSRNPDDYSDSGDEDPNDASASDSDDEDIDAPKGSRGKVFSPPQRAQPPSPTLSAASNWAPTPVAAASQSVWNSKAKVAASRSTPGNSTANSALPSVYTAGSAQSSRANTSGWVTPSPGTATPGAQSVVGAEGSSANSVAPSAVPSSAKAWSTVASRGGGTVSAASQQAFPALGAPRSGHATPVGGMPPRIVPVPRGTPAPRGSPATRGNGMTMRGGATSSGVTSPTGVASGATTRASYTTAPTPGSGWSTVGAGTPVTVSQRGGWIKTSRAKQEIQETDFSAAFTPSPSIPVEPNGIANGQVRMAPKKKRNPNRKKESNSDDSDYFATAKNPDDDDNEEY